MDCKHISKASLFPTSNSCLLSPREWSCNSENCGTTESVWACLSCNSVACGRYIEEHALKHFNKTNHPLAIEVNDLFVYCYLCDDYVLNDNAAGELKLTRSILRSLHLQSFSICETRSGRVLRSVQPSNSEIKAKKEKIKQEDIVLNALCQRRLCLIRRAYFAWKENSTFQKHKRSWIKSNPGRPLPSPVSPKSSKLAELLKKKRKRASESDDVTSRTSSLTGWA